MISGFSAGKRNPRSSSGSMSPSAWSPQAVKLTSPPRDLSGSSHEVLIRSSWDDPDRSRGGEVNFTAWGDHADGLIDPLLDRGFLFPAEKPEIIRSLASPREDDSEKVYISYAWGEDTTDL